MRRILVLIGIGAFMLTTASAGAQEKEKVEKSEVKATKVIEDPDTELTLGDERMKISSDDEKTIVRLGKRSINIYDTESGPSIRVTKNDDASDTDHLFRDQDEEGSRPSRLRFTPHWSGFEFGFNNYLGADYATSLPPAYNFMDLNTGKSYNINIHFAQLGFGLTRHFGLVTGLGFEFNDYVFEGNYNIMKNNMGEIVEYDASTDGISLDKSKLSTTYFVVPVMFELQVPVKRNNTINFAAGVIGGAKVSSHTKMVYHDDGKQKVKEKNDFSLNLLRYGPTVRVGYESFQLYATYYMNGLFKDGKGPELYPIQVGIAFTFD